MGASRGGVTARPSSRLGRAARVWFPAALLAGCASLLPSGLDMPSGIEKIRWERPPISGRQLGDVAGPSRPAAAPTWTETVARVVRDRCEECHRPAGGGPFSLTSYDEARPWAERIAASVRAGTMPPWPPVPGYGRFWGERALSPAERHALLAWAEGGATRGPEQALLLRPRWPEGWRIGTPDAVLSTPEYAPATNGRQLGDLARPQLGSPDEYRCFPVASPFAADQYISAVEVRPGNLALVHHVTVYVDPTGAALALDRATPGPGYPCPMLSPGVPEIGRLGGWVPGWRPEILPRGIGYLLPAGGAVVLQLHYAGSAARGHAAHATDRTELGLRLARAPIDKRLHVQRLYEPAQLVDPAPGEPDRRLRIPAGAPRFRARVSHTLDEDITLLGVAPHMHLLGREFRAVATLPDGPRGRRADGQVRPLIFIDAWAFEWQGSYAFREPVKLPRGTVIEFEGTFDNSAANPRNPFSPPREVVGGLATTDEMLFMSIGYTRDAERIGWRPSIGAARQGPAVGGLLPAVPD